MRPLVPALLCLAALASGCSAPDVSVVLTPTTPELATVLVEADRRWEAAGVAPDRIVLGLHGAPVRVAEELGHVHDGASEVLGKTVGYRSERRFGGVRRMDLASLDLANVVHELGHALGIGVGFVSHPFDSDPACALDAPSRPVMCEVGGDTITELDLTEACDIGACVAFNPELPAQE
jgi:hypothetical protein